jgi:hypothetical protein
MLIHLCNEIRSKKSSYTFIIPFESETKFQENHKRISRFIGKKGRNLNTLENKYNVVINLINIDSNKKNIINELHISIRRKNKLEKNTIPFDVIRQDIVKKWEEASEIQFIKRELSFDHNQYQFVSLSFQSELSLEECHYIKGYFIGKNGENLRNLENEYQW